MNIQQKKPGGLFNVYNLLRSVVVKLCGLVCGTNERDECFQERFL